MKNKNNEHSVVITGASKGIGRALAIGFSRQGWRIALLARNEEGLHKTYKRLDPHPKGHIVQPCDISVWTDCQKAVERVKGQFGYINALINDAFGYGEKPLEEMDPGDIHDFFETSATGNVLVTKAFLGLLEESFKATSKKSQIINIVADWGFPMHNLFTGTSIYVAGKYAMHGFGVALHREVAPKGINVTNVYPGIVASSLDIDDDLDRLRDEFGNTAIPLKDLVNLILTTTMLSSSVVRHIVLSPDNPTYDGL
ncbi:MAG: putative ketoacyl reductase [candidate division WS2 bacterium]|nr:putative ketoacyl reductase [Candidatus Lithacetigena glycinireducens]